MLEPLHRKGDEEARRLDAERSQRDIFPLLQLEMNSFVYPLGLTSSFTIAGMNALYGAPSSAYSSSLQSQRVVVDMIVDKSERILARMSNFEIVLSYDEAANIFLDILLAGQASTTRLAADACDLITPSSHIDVLPCVGDKARDSISTDPARLPRGTTGSVSSLASIATTLPSIANSWGVNLRAARCGCVTAYSRGELFPPLAKAAGV